jgi:hypothetical protein
LTGLGFPIASVSLSVAAGAVASLLVYRLIAPVTDRLGARLLVVVGVNTFVCAPVFQIAYSEALALALLAATLLAFQKGQRTLTALFVLLLSLTRAVVLPLSALFAISALVQWRRGAGRRPVASSLGLAGWAFATTFLWPFIAGLRTGEPKAYLLTQAAWNPAIVDPPVLRFIHRASTQVGGPWVATVMAVVWALMVVGILTFGQRHRLLRLWSALYALYLLAAVDWNPSALRYYTLALPALWGPIDKGTGWSKTTRATLAGVVALLGLLSQWWWIRYSLTISPELHQLP